MIGVAEKFTEMPGQTVVAEAVILTEGTTRSFTVIRIVLLVTAAGVAHVALDVMITVTLSLLDNVDEVKLGLLVPTFTPFTCHWYEGVAPPFTGVAVNVTGVPAQILFPGLAAIFTEATGLGFTVTVTGLISEQPAAVVPLM